MQVLKRIRKAWSSGRIEDGSGFSRTYNQRIFEQAPDSLPENEL